MSFNTIPDILDDIRAGRMVVILDDEDRENEGDLVMAAEKVRPEDINFMVREARGLVCLTLTVARCRQLGLKPMVHNNTSSHHTNFTVSIEAAEGVTTGISAYDRAHTIRTAVAADARPEHLAQPGHIFPLTAQTGGVLVRAGHTEAACDLATMAGLEPAGVIVEVMDDDGTMARRPALEAFAGKHGLKIGTIADLIRYRLQTENTIERVHDAAVDTEFGVFRLVVYRDLVQKALHFALVRGDVGDGKPVLTRVHVRNTLSDVLHMRRDDLGLTITWALRRIANEDRGIVVVLSETGEAEALLDSLTGKIPLENVDPAREWRRNGLGAQILADLDVRHLRVLGTPRKLVGLAGFDLDVVGYEDLSTQSSDR